MEVSIWSICKEYSLAYTTVSIKSCLPDFAGLIREEPNKRLVQKRNVRKFVRIYNSIINKERG